MDEMDPYEWDPEDMEDDDIDPGIQTYFAEWKKGQAEITEKEFDD
jgi:hypothetical protein